MALSYFNAEVGGVEQLWISDGTAAGSHLVASFGSGAIFDLTTIGARAFFDVDDGTHGQELWTSDGTAAGTVMVKDIDPGPNGSQPSGLTAVNGALYFTADDGVHGAELWKSDGTAAGTAMVKDIAPSATGSFPSNLTNVNGEPYFSANDGAFGTELWKSDGTATVMVKDILAGSGGSAPSDFANVNGALEFLAYDGTGEGLFRSDGTDAGTIEIAANIQTTTPPGVTAPPPGFARDFNGDGFSDILWQNATGQAAIWEVHGTSQVAGGSQILPANPGPGWTEVGAGDFNGDGHSDILWQDANGQTVIWEMNGTNVIGGGALSLNAGPGWKAVGTGDFNGDGLSDILWQNASSG